MFDAPNMEFVTTKTDRELLKAIYRLLPDASTGTIAARLGLTPSTISTHIKRLTSDGLITHEPYQNAVLTQEGSRIAVAAIRRHRIVERFLADMLGYPWNEADRLAGTFEHELPQEVEDRLFVALGRPDTCPHGFPIPEQDTTEEPGLRSLVTLEAGHKGLIAVEESTEQDVVEYLASLGIVPGVQVEIKERHPFDGPVVLKVKGRNRTIGHAIAAQIFVSKPRKEKSA